MVNEEPAELTEPLASVVNSPPSFIVSVVTALLELFARRIGVVGPGPRPPRGLLSRAALRSGDPDPGECVFRKRNFLRRGTIHMNFQWKTVAVDQYHPHRSLVTCVMPPAEMFLLAEVKLLYRKVSSHLSSPRGAECVQRSQQSRHTSCSSHYLSTRRQIAGEKYGSGRNGQLRASAAPRECRLGKSRFDERGGRARPCVASALAQRLDQLLLLESLLAHARSSTKP
jgi:hypothetical protein